MVTWGEYGKGGYPDADELYRKQSVEQDRTKHETRLLESHRLVHERVMYFPLDELVWPMASALAWRSLGSNPFYGYTGPYEEIRWSYSQRLPSLS